MTDFQWAEQAAEDVRLRVEEGSTVEVAAEPPDTRGQLHLTLRITVPDGVATVVETAHGDVRAERLTGDLTVTTASGRIDASGVMGKIDLSTASGPIHIREPGAAVAARTSSGPILVEATAIGGSFDLTSVTGPVTLHLPPTASADVTFRTTSGRVEGPPWLTLMMKEGTAERVPWATAPIR